MANLSIRLLGPFQVKLSGVPVTSFASDKVRALLAYLATEADQLHRRDRLAGLLWPNSPQETARTNLRRALADLRQVIKDHQADPPYLLITRQAIQFNSLSHAWVDSAVFTQAMASKTIEETIQHLEDAAALYRGCFLEGFFLGDSMPFEEWALLQRERFQREALALLHRLANHYEKCCAYEPALQYTWRQVELDPLQESAQRQVMRLLALTGQRTAALSQFESFRRLLAEELDTKPEVKTARLQQQIQDELVTALTQPSSPPQKLPLQATPFVGRDRELKALDVLIAQPDVRLITITGAGGMGKTRLAVALAEQQYQATLKTDPNGEWRFPDGVFFVHLAGVHQTDQIIPAVADALDFTHQGDGRDGRSFKQQCLDFLRHKRALLVMDNFEQLLPGAKLLADILHQAPELKMVVTSREHLHLREEQVFPIQGLAFLEKRPEDVGKIDAVTLFLQSARRVQPDFIPDPEELKRLASICRHMEGMPLAIELAASWVDALSLAELNTEIQRSLDCLETAWQNGPARHRSLRATFDVSWQQLNQTEQSAFAGLSVFQGGFTRAAAQEGAGVSLRPLAVLAGKSLLSFNRTDGRYEIHELLRQYGAEKLAQEKGRESAVRDRHAACYCALLARQAVHLRQPNPQRQTAANLIAADIKNVRVAWQWVSDKQQIKRLKQALDGLCRFYEWRNYYQEGVVACQTAVQSINSFLSLSKTDAETHRLLAKALAWQGVFHRYLGNTEKARRCLKKSLSLFERSPLVVQETHSDRAFIHLKMGHCLYTLDNAQAIAHFQQSLDLARMANDHEGIIEAHLALGEISLGIGHFKEARHGLEEGLTLARSLGNSWQIVEILDKLGWTQRRLMAYDEAQQLFAESLALAQADSYQKGAAIALESLGALALFQGRLDKAVDLIRQSLSLFRQIGQPLDIAASLAFLSGALRWSGSFVEAHKLAEEGVTLYKAVGNTDAISRGLRYVAALNVDQRQYDTARDQAQSALALSRVGHGWSWRLIGWTELAQGEFGPAYYSFTKSVDFYRMTLKGDREALSISLAALGRAAYGLGKQSEARLYLLEALNTAVAIKAFIPGLFILPFLSLLLADVGEPSLAAEAYALANAQPYVAKSGLFADVMGQEITAPITALSSKATKTWSLRQDLTSAMCALVDRLHALPLAR